MTRLVKSRAGVNVLLGAWLAISPFVLNVNLDVARWNHVLVGSLIVLVAGYNYGKAGDNHPGNVRAAILVTLLGLWTIVSPFMVGFPDLTGFLNDLVVGVLIALFASYDAYQIRIACTEEQTTSP